MKTIASFFNMLSKYPSYFQSILMSFIGYKMVAQIQKNMFKNLMNCDLSYFSQTNTGTLVSRFILDVGSISRGIHNVIINIIKYL